MDHAFFSLSGRYSQGDLHHQQRGGTASLTAQDHQNPGIFSQRRVGAETAVSGDPTSLQKVDDAGAELEPSFKLLHRAVAGTNVQTRWVGIMQLEFFSTWTQGKGNCPLPLQPIPKNNNNNNKTKNNTNINPKNNTNINNKTEPVYTEGLTHPDSLTPNNSPTIAIGYMFSRLPLSRD